jgi:predicted dehydrogenase
MAIKPAKLGIIGCGNISGIYCQNAKKLEALDLAACADLIRERSEAKAKEYGIPKVLSPEELLADPEIEIVLDLTVPKAHAEVALAAIEGGKSVYNEKPLAVTRADGKKILDAAKRKKVRVGCAPDTFLGAGIQTCRKLIDDGWIGQPIGAVAFFSCRGHERWHPDPEFYYEVGGGPVLDMGPYYITALVNLLGPVRRVTGSTRKSFETRTITSQPKYGKVIPVELPTHVAGTLDFVGGAVATIMLTFDVWEANLPRIEIYGTLGTLSVPDPNTFGGPVQLWVNGDLSAGRVAGWKEVPLTHGYPENSRGLGVADMAAALRSGRPHRANGDMAFHVLDVMEAVDDASRSGKHIEVASTCERPHPFPMGLLPGTVDE